MKVKSLRTLIVAVLGLVALLVGIPLVRPAGELGGKLYTDLCYAVVLVVAAAAGRSTVQALAGAWATRPPAPAKPEGAPLDTATPP